jgi:hypothetical protein
MAVKGEDCADARKLPLEARQVRTALREGRWPLTRPAPPPRRVRRTRRAQRSPRPHRCSGRLRHLTASPCPGRGPLLRTGPELFLLGLADDGSQVFGKALAAVGAAFLDQRGGCRGLIQVGAGLHPRLPARHEMKPVARLATRPAQPRLDPGLDFLIRGNRVLPRICCRYIRTPASHRSKTTRNFATSAAAITAIVGSSTLAGPQDTRPGTAGALPFPDRTGRQIPGRHPKSPVNTAPGHRPGRLRWSARTLQSPATRPRVIDDQQTHR